MRLSDLPTRKLRRAIKATEKAVGPSAPEVLLLQKELARRRSHRRADRGRLEFLANLLRSADSERDTAPP